MVPFIRRSSTVLLVKRQQKNSEIKALTASAASSSVAIGLVFIINGTKLYWGMQTFVQCLLTLFLPEWLAKKRAMTRHRSINFPPKKSQYRGFVAGTALIRPEDGLARDMHKSRR